MSAKRKPWAKVRHALYTDERSLELSGVAISLRVHFTVWGIEDPEQRVAGDVAAGVGWMLTEDGDPYTIRRLARLARFPEREIERALAELQAARIIVRSDAGAWGLIGWSASQEDPSAARVRAHRERGRSRDSEPGVTDDARYSNASETAEERGERRELSNNSNSAGARDPDSPGSPPENPPAPDRPPGSWRSLGERIRLTRTMLGFGHALIASRTGIDARTLRQIEADELVPIRAELDALADALGDQELRHVPLPDRDPSVAAAVVGALHEQRRELGEDGPRPPVDADAIRLVFAPSVPEGMSRGDAWLTVIRRAGEEARRNVEDGRPNRDREFMTLRSLGGAARWRKYLDNPDLDRRREKRRAAREPPQLRLTGPKNHELKPDIERDEEDEET